MTRSLMALHPDLRARARALVRAWVSAGIPLIVTGTLRTRAEQDALYAQGRTTPGPIVTKARGGHSWHNFGLALDVVPVFMGKPVWNHAHLWTRIGQVAEAQGWQWGGRWTTMPDKPHVQFVPPGVTLAQLRALPVQTTGPLAGYVVVPGLVREAA